MVVHIFVSNSFAVIGINTVKTISDSLHLVTVKCYCHAEGYFFFASKNVMKVAASCFMTSFVLARIYRLFRAAFSSVTAINAARLAETYETNLDAPVVFIQTCRAES
jgi:hypothetical protein